MEWQTDWITHDLPRFVVTMDTECLDNRTLYVKELNIRGKRSSKKGYFKIKSRVRENISGGEYYKCSIDCDDGGVKAVWRQRLPKNTK